MKFTFLTSGAARINNVGNRTINFKSTIPKNLSTKGKISTLVIQALKQIKKGNVIEIILNKISEQFKNEEENNILHHAKLAQAWIREILLKSLINE